MRQSLFYFSGAEKYWLRQLTRDVKSDVRLLNFRSDVIFVPPRKKDIMRHNMSKIKGMINNNFNVIGKKNNQTSVSDADRQIPTLGSTDNAGNSVSLVSGFWYYPFTFGLGVFGFIAFIIFKDLFLISSFLS